MQKFDRRGLIYGIVGIQERVLVRQGKRAIRVRVIEILLCFCLSCIFRSFSYDTPQQLKICSPAPPPPPPPHPPHTHTPSKKS